MEEKKHYPLTNLRDHSIEAPFAEELKTMTVYIPKLKKSLIISWSSMVDWFRDFVVNGGVEDSLDELLKIIDGTL